MAPSICSQPRCSSLVTKLKPCPTHPPAAKARRQELDQHRGSAASRGYDGRWKKARLGYLAKHPLCVSCERQGRVTAAYVVDHVQPHKGAYALFWCPPNWQALCDRRGYGCHEAKTARENGLAACRAHGAAVAEVMGERVCRDCGRAA